MHAEYVHLLFLWEKCVAAAAFSLSLSVWNQVGCVEICLFIKGFIKNIFFKLSFRLIAFSSEKKYE